MLIRIASRSSFLAKWQAYEVGRAILQAFPEYRIEYQFRESLGDKNLIDPLWKMPEKGVFTEDFYSDLVENRCDLIVHSWKDLPTEEKEKTFIAATLARADQRDLLLFKKSSHGKNKVVIFSSSPRRVHHVKETLEWSLPFTAEIGFTDVRGNIQTRINKLMQNETIDGLILAKAALDRLLNSTFYAETDFLQLQSQLKTQLQNFDFQILPLSTNPTAAAQGALAVEILRSREDLKALLATINCQADFANCSFERAKLAEFGGGCHQKIGLSVVEVSKKRVFFASGVKENAGLIYNKSVLGTFDQKYSPTEVLSSTELWSSVERKNIAEISAFDSKAVLISKRESLHSFQLNNCAVFTAGVETWKQLAKQKLWVHGTTDSLGESQLPDLQSWIADLLNLKDSTWYKLTHQNSPVVESRQRILNVATYQLHYEPKAGLNLKNLKMIYWKSGIEYLRAIAIWPELKGIRHACGLGQTSKTIGSQAEPHKVTLYYNEKDWRNSVLQTF